jgi:regulator of protease activity HflC (stomatin/prohibitin superfamily)
MVRAQAAGEADAKETLAKADAESIRIRGEALRQNPEVMQLEAINKWNGTLPQYMTAGTVPRSLPLSNRTSQRRHFWRLFFLRKISTIRKQLV